MKKFLYRMQNILDIQYKLEEQAKTAFGAANTRLKQEEDILRERMQQQQQYEAEYKDLMQQDLDILKIKECRNAIDIMKSRVRTQMIEVHVAEKNADSARKKLTDAMVTRKSHEVLREKEFEVYKQESASEENKMIDELVSYTHSQKEE